MHFTHVEHLTTIARDGLLGDAAARSTGSLQVEVGNHGIKEQRRRRVVPIAPGGVVADYAPFYFAPRSPMMYAIEKGNVATYTGGCDELVYLVSDVERLLDLQLPTVFTDRNAVLGVTTFTDDPASLETLVDWQLMRARDWYNTPTEPDRRERRMAECLVHDRVPWSAFRAVVVRKEECATRAGQLLAAAGVDTRIVVRPDWYF
ncbi:MAG TPA: DUF4433 domain-containing protein [Jatrophihabitans sp.]|nr:DUF4433 domain-containing protein [Jatrophihabitans sp.]